MPLIRSRVILRNRGFQGLGVVAADVQPVAEGDCLAHTGMPPQLLRKLMKARPRDRPRGEMRLRDDIRNRPVREQAPVGDVCQPVTSFGLIHVVGSDQEGKAFRGELMNLLPEFPPRLRIYAGRRFIKQQKPGLMNQAGRQRKPLLPAARQLTSQLLPAFRESESLETPLDGLSPLSVLGRGYALVWDEARGRLVRSALEVAPGEALRLRLHQGALRATVTSRETE